MKTHGKKTDQGEKGLSPWRLSIQSTSFETG